MNQKEVMQFRKAVQEAVNKADLYFLIEGGAPLDEYDSCVDNIVSILINQKPSHEQLYLKLCEIFKNEDFGLPLPDRKEIVDLADELLELYGNLIKHQ